MANGTKQSKLNELTGKRLQAFIAHQRDYLGRQITIVSLARELGVEPDRCGAWVNGKNEFPPYYAARLQELYGLGVTHMYSLDPGAIYPQYVELYRTPTLA